jgi:hypothetical protein
MAGNAERANRDGNHTLAATLRAESQELYAKVDEYAKNARKGIITKAEYERRVKAGKLPPAPDLDDWGPLPDSFFHRYGQ